MASLHLSPSSLINESRVFFGSSLKSRVGFRTKHFRRVTEKWKFRAQQISLKEQITKHELVPFAKRSESVIYILKQYGISVKNPEEDKTSSRLDDREFEEKHDDVPSVDVDDSKMQYGVLVENPVEDTRSSRLDDFEFEEKHDVVTSVVVDESKTQYGVSVENPEEDTTSSRLDDHEFEEKRDVVPSVVVDDSKMQYGVTVENPEEDATSSRVDDGTFEEEHVVVTSVVVDDSKMNTAEESPDICREEIYCETVSTAEKLSGQNHHNFPHLNTGALFTSLLAVLGFCIICIIGTLHIIISRKTSQGDHHHGSKETRWRTALSDLNDPLPSDEQNPSTVYRVGSTNEEDTDEAYSRVELEYKRFLLECGVSES